MVMPTGVVMVVTTGVVMVVAGRGNGDTRSGRSDERRENRAHGGGARRDVASGGLRPRFETF